MTELFPGDQLSLRPLAENHPIWKAKHQLSPTVHPFWGIERGGRTVVVYSPRDLSCYWNQSERDAASPAVIKAAKVGQNVIEYATSGKVPPDKLSVP